jgi:anti-anti-sigma factor
MKLEIVETDQTAQVTVVGELVSDSCGKFRDTLLGLISKDTLSEVVLDLSQMPFIDSSGLGVFVGLRTHCRKHKTELKLANTQPNVVRIFTLMRLDKVFQL